MKDLSKRFINIHSGLGPLATVEASKGVLVEQHNQHVHQVASSGFFKSALASSEAQQQQQYFPLLPQPIILPHTVQPDPGGGINQGMSWMINSGQGLLPMAGVRTGLGFGTAADQTAQYFQHPAQQGLSTFLVPSPLDNSSLLAAKANFSPLYSPPSSLSPPLYSSSTSPPLDPSGVGGATYLHLPHGLQTVLPSGLILAQSPKPKGSHKSYSEKRRSALLEEFRNNLLPALTLGQLAGHVVEFAEDQHGSRFIQQKLESAPAQEREAVFQELQPSCLSLMTDVFGNYVIQKFFQHGSDEQRGELLKKILPQMETLTVQMYGCRVIQKALETVSKEEQRTIVQKLEGKVEEFVKDQNGNHVIQKCIEVVDSAHCQFVLDAFKNKVFVMACHPFGCRVVQRVLEHCTQQQTSALLEELLGSTDQLLQDQYGNYVIQHILDRGRQEHKSRIVSCVSGRVVSLSQHKFASNVVEKCVSNAMSDERAALIREVCQPEGGDSCPAIGLMIRDQYANYVVQKMIDTGGAEELAILMSKIRLHISALHKFTYGKHILAKLENYYANNP